MVQTFAALHVKMDFEYKYTRILLLLFEMVIHYYRYASQPVNVYHLPLIFHWSQLCLAMRYRSNADDE